MFPSIALERENTMIETNDHDSSIHYSSSRPISNSTERNAPRVKNARLPNSTTINAEASEFCEANVLISLIDGVETRRRCQSPWSHIYITTEKRLVLLCDFHGAFMDFAIASDEDAYETGGAA